MFRLKLLDINVFIYNDLQTLYTRRMAEKPGVDRLIRQREVCDRVGVSRTSIWRLVRNGRFPRPTTVGVRPRWSEVEIQEWIAKRLDDRGQSH